MKKLRLVFTQDCNRACIGCYNKDWNLDDIPIVDHFNYDEILITGGEPLLYPDRLIGYVQAIRAVSSAKIFVYTAVTIIKRTFKPIYDVINAVDGVTLTLHNQQDVDNFSHVLYSIKNDYLTEEAFKGKSLRLNVFKGVDTRHLNLNGWIVKGNMEWIKDCPLPADEVLMKI